METSYKNLSSPSVSNLKPKAILDLSWRGSSQIKS